MHVSFIFPQYLKPVSLHFISTCRQKEKEQMEALRRHHTEEIEHHKKEIERLQKEIDRHKGKIRKLKHDDWNWEACYHFPFRPSDCQVNYYPKLIDLMLVKAVPVQYETSYWHEKYQFNNKALNFSYFMKVFEHLCESVSFVYCPQLWSVLWVIVFFVFLNEAAPACSLYRKMNFIGWSRVNQKFNLRGWIVADEALVFNHRAARSGWMSDTLDLSPALLVRNPSYFPTLSKVGYISNHF